MGGVITLIYPLAVAGLYGIKKLMKRNIFQCVNWLGVLLIKDV